MKLIETKKMQEGFHVVAKTSRSEAATMVLGAGDKTGGSDNKHEGSNQWLLVVSGSGKALVEVREHPLREGALLLIEAGETHDLITSSDEPLRTLNFYAPPVY